MQVKEAHHAITRSATSIVKEVHRRIVNTSRAHLRLGSLALVMNRHALVPFSLGLKSRIVFVKSIALVLQYTVVASKLVHLLAERLSLAVPLVRNVGQTCHICSQPSNRGVVAPVQRSVLCSQLLQQPEMLRL